MPFSHRLCVSLASNPILNKWKYDDGLYKLHMLLPLPVPSQSLCSCQSLLVYELGSYLNWILPWKRCVFSLSLLLAVNEHACLAEGQIQDE